ncbi:hypothetical protein GJ496_009095 [Pomphorhynchus laevis]|nr:hypothetical protein GJ496_009095 [Pomphorhynchus laevis]
MTNSKLKRTVFENDLPPYSRLFILVPKSTTEKKLTECFSLYGHIEDIWLLREKSTGSSRGICYIKYSKASSAALAMEKMNGQYLDEFSKPLKVMISNNRNERNIRQPCEAERMLRIFLLLPKEFTSDDLYQTFKKFGEIYSVQIVVDKVTGKSRGLGYVKFFKASDSARALEECDPAFKPKFADPPISKIRDSNNIFFDNKIRKHRKLSNLVNQEQSDIHLKRPYKLLMQCTKAISAVSLNSLCDLIPYLTKFKTLSTMTINEQILYLVEYGNIDSYQYALQKLNGYRFPSGEVIYVYAVEERLDETYERQYLENESSELLLTEIKKYRLNITARKRSQQAANTNEDLTLHKSAICSCSEAMRYLLLLTNNSKIHDSWSPSLHISETLEDTGFCSVYLPPEKPVRSESCYSKVSVLKILSSVSIPTNVLLNVFCRFGNLIEVCMNDTTSMGHTMGLIVYGNEFSARMACNVMNGQEIAGVKIFISEVCCLNYKKTN